MLETIIIFLLVIWILATMFGQSLSGMLWLLLMISAVLFVVRMVTSQRREV